MYMQINHKINPKDIPSPYDGGTEAVRRYLAVSEMMAHDRVHPSTCAVYNEIYYNAFIEKLKENRELSYYDTLIDANYSYETDGVYMSQQVFLRLNKGQGYVSFTVITNPGEDPIINGIIIYHNTADTEFLEGLLKLISECLVEEQDEKLIYMISYNEGYKLASIPVKPVEVDLALNYGEEFLAVDEAITDALTNGSSGIVLLHGVPGSGKTTYIKYLINKLAGVCDKKFVYVPAHLMWNIASPEFINFGESLRNSVIVIEDAESIIKSRNGDGGDGAVSNLLSLTDGLLNERLGTQVICTFNMNKSDIDQALMRAGRLLKDYEFDNLKAESATKLSANLGKNIKYENEASLAEVYAGIVPDKNTSKKVGFKS